MLHTPSHCGVTTAGTFLEKICLSYAVDPLSNEVLPWSEALRVVQLTEKLSGVRDGKVDDRDTSHGHLVVEDSIVGAVED